MIYLLHFDAPYKHARHYLGFSTQFEKREEHHRNGRGARLTAAVAAAGIGWTCVRKWENGDRTMERRLHNRNNNAKLCPVCRAGKKDAAPGAQSQGPLGHEDKSV